jgi:beta-glucosidase
LRGFTRIHLGAGETHHVHFVLDPRDLSEVNEKGDRIVAEGSYRISVGGGQPGTSAPQAETEFTIKGSQRLPD